MPPASGLETATRWGGVPPCITDRSAARTVADAMLTDVKISPADATVSDLRRLFADDHVHVALIVANHRLLTVIARTDLAGRHSGPAMDLGRRQSRIIAPQADLEQTRRAMLGSGRRRLAVVNADGTLRGLLCLKRDGTGFCSDVGVRARALARCGAASISDDANRYSSVR